MQTRLSISIILLIFTVFLVQNISLHAEDRWWDNTFRYRKILTFNNARRSENLTDFPVLIKLTESNFDFSKVQTSGQDIRFIDADNSTQLSYEIEDWNYYAKKAIIWVKVPQVDADSTSDYIYLYYGNSSANDAQSKSSVWNNHYLGVWHMNQDPGSSNVLDSTSNGYHALPAGAFSGALNDARVGKGISFTTSNKLYYNATNAFRFPINQDFSVSIWTKEDLANNRAFRAVIGTNWTGSPRVGWWFLTWYGNPDSFFQIQNQNINVLTSTSTQTVNLIDGNWHHLTGVRQGDIARYYIDGNLVSTQTGANVDLSASSTLTWAWTSNNSPTVNYAGVLDETQISDAARSSEWINASYASMTDNFLTYSDEKNSVTNTMLSLNNTLDVVANNNYRLSGTVRVSDIQFLPSAVQYQINGSGWRNGVPTDGAYDTLEDSFYFDFSPKINNNSGEGFTARVRTVRGSEIQADNLFYFRPFNPVKPENDSTLDTDLPRFTFEINKDRFEDIKNSLNKFEIELNKNGTGWKTYIGDIPVDYESIKSRDDNFKKTTSQTNGNGLYEDKRIWISYANNNSTIDVFAKAADTTGRYTDNYFDEGGKKLSNGKYQWRVVAIDKLGHRQESDVRTFQIGTIQVIKKHTFFPLTILSISGIGSVSISTTQLKALKPSYTTWSATPTFYGIAFADSEVTLKITDVECEKKQLFDCTRTLRTITNQESRWGINIPANILRYGKNYKIQTSVSLEGDYNELPSFNLIHAIVNNKPLGLSPKPKSK